MGLSQIVVFCTRTTSISWRQSLLLAHKKPTNWTHGSSISLTLSILRVVSHWMHISESFIWGPLWHCTSRNALRQLLAYQVDVVSVCILVIFWIVDKFNLNFGHVVGSMDHMSDGSLLNEVIVALQKVWSCGSFTLLCYSCRHSLLTTGTSLDFEAEWIAFV